MIMIWLGLALASFEPKDCVVRIVYYGKEATSETNGFFVDTGGVVATTLHGIAGVCPEDEMDSLVVITSRGVRGRVNRILSSSPEGDLCLLDVGLSNRCDLRPGNPPLPGDSLSVLTYRAENQIKIRLNAPIEDHNHVLWYYSFEHMELGLAGCPAVDEKGMLVAMVSGTYSLVPYDRIKKLMAEQNPVSPRRFREELARSSYGFMAFGLNTVMSGDTLGAVEFFKRAVQLGPDQAQAHYTLGNVLFLAGDYESAKKQWEQTIRIDSAHIGARNNLAIVLRQQGDVSGAEFQIRKIIQLNPHDSEAHNNLGLILSDQGKNKEAEAEYRKSIEINPDYPAPHNNLGLLLEEQDRLKEAEAEYRKALNIRPDYAVVRYNLAELLRSQGRLDEAEAEYRKVISADSNDAFAHLQLGEVLRQQGRPEEAEAEYRRAVEISPDYLDAHYSLALLLMAQHRFQEAESRLRQVIKIDPDNAEAHGNLGLLLMEQGDLQGAREELTTAEKLFEAQGRKEDAEKARQILQELQ